MKKVSVALVVLATVLWFSPDRLSQVLLSLRSFTKAVGPDVLPDQVAPSVDATNTKEPS